jgi:hypothetical protein
MRDILRVTGSCKETETLIDERGFDQELESMIGETRNVPWAKKDEDVLIRYYGKVKTSALVKRLNRSHASVSAKVRELGLKFEAPIKSD